MNLYPCCEHSYPLEAEPCRRYGHLLLGPLDSPWRSNSPCTRAAQITILQLEANQSLAPIRQRERARIYFVSLDRQFMHKSTRCTSPGSASTTVRSGREMTLLSGEER